MHMTLNYNLGMSTQAIEKLLLQAVSVTLAVILFASAVSDVKKIIPGDMTHAVEEVSDWVFSTYRNNYKRETWEQRVQRLMHTNLEAAGGLHLAVKNKDVRCLAENVYYESRGESLKGQVAVAKVTLNRLDEGFARSVCGVVYQRASAESVCQFEWVCNRAELSRPVGEAWTRAVGVAVAVLNEKHRIEDPTNGATFFHATYIDWKPGWRRVQESVRQIGNHVFYRTQPKKI